MDVGFIISYSWLGFLAISTLVLVFFWKDYYFIYNYRLLYVVGLAFSRSLTSYAIITVLVWYFTDYGNDLVTSAVFFNIQGSLSSFLVIFMAHAADSFVGRFQALLFSNTAYIGGLMLLWLFNPYDVKWLIVVILVLLSLGTSGSNILQDVLKDLVNDIDKSQDRNKTRSLARAAIWSRIAYVSGAISAIMWVAPDAIGGVHSSWSSSFLICMITMTITLTIFCNGHNIYHQGELTKRPVEAFFRVFLARIKKLPKFNTRRLTKFTRQDRPQQNLKTKKKENKEITQERSSLDLDTKGKEDMIVVRSLLRMFPMWGMFFVVSLISATGSTFFLQQYNNLNTNSSISIQIYNLFQDSSSFCIPFLYTWICGLHKNNKVQIGVGMLCGIVSCICAFVLEVYRLKEVNELVDKNTNTSISFLWLLPQFCVLGCMEGLTGEGLLEFYMSQMKEEPLRSYGEDYIEIVMGFGKLLNIFLILIFESQLGWFGNTINNSRLDNYYLVLVYVGSANFIIYCYIARCFYKDDERLQDLVGHNQIQDNQFLDNEQDHGCH
ncbi:putative proton-dependent oligopeptide transporter family, MFS transporter superfamily protein [Tanacetum coccineum]